MTEKIASSDLVGPGWGAFEAKMEEVLAGRPQGRPCQNNQKVINGILWINDEGATWRAVPERYGSWNTIYSRFNRWQKAGIWDEIWQRLIQEGAVEGPFKLAVDSTICQAHPDASGAKKNSMSKLKSAEQARRKRKR